MVTLLDRSAKSVYRKHSHIGRVIATIRRFTHKMELLSSFIMTHHKGAVKIILVFLTFLQFLD